MFYLCGVFNNWVVQDEYVFEYRCDVYYFNFRVQGMQEFKFVDEDWMFSFIFGVDVQGWFMCGVVGNFLCDFNGEQMLCLCVDVDGCVILDVGLWIFCFMLL